MPVYTCDASGNGLFYWSANPGVPTFGGTQVTSRKDGTYDVNFDRGPGTDGSAQGSTSTYMAPDYVDPDCIDLGGGVYVPRSGGGQLPPQRIASQDVVIRAGGTATVPLNWVVPGSAELQPLAIYAEFDGSGAGGDYKPAVSLLAAGGTKQWTAQTDEVVTAGDDARVSWAPGFRGAPTAAAPTGALAVASVLGAFNAPAQTIVPAINDIVTFDAATFRTSDAAVFSFNSTFNTITGQKPGLYIAWYELQRAFLDLDSNKLNARLDIQDLVPGNQQEPHGGGDMVSFNGATATSMDKTVCSSFGICFSGAVVQAQFNNLSAANVVLSLRILCVAFLCAIDPQVPSPWPGYG